MAKAKNDNPAERASRGERTGKDSREEKRGLLLASALTDIGKRYGPEAIMRLGEGSIVKCDVISTGSLGLNAAIGVGGVPRGRIVEFYGPESSGKTTLALQCVANAQLDGGTAAFIDAEHALDPAYARRLGVNLDTLLVSQPDCGEQALDICEMLVRSNAVDVIVVDSVAALTPKAEIEGEMGQSHMGLQARLMSQGLRKLTGIVKKSNSCIIFINQIRMKIGIMFGNPETTTGGNALKFYASLRLDIRRGKQVKKGDTILGNETTVKVVKNKMAPPFKSVSFEILFNQGVNRLGELVDLAITNDILSKAGNWISYGDTRIGNGRDVACEFLRNHSDIAGVIEEKLKKLLEDNAIAMAEADRGMTQPVEEAAVDKEVAAPQ
ncbi:MAG: recombinase RecA [Planctomycetota bacterium]|jgi:recombination protein RecA|nr:recombinase RecA [Planctomycetota bacterium]